jgi:hypothetical protein
MKFVTLSTFFEGDDEAVIPSAIYHTLTSFYEVGFLSNDSAVPIPVCLAALTWVCPINQSLKMSLW